MKDRRFPVIFSVAVVVYFTCVAWVLWWLLGDAVKWALIKTIEFMK